jgi:hypothetical protein
MISQLNWSSRRFVPELASGSYKTGDSSFIAKVIAEHISTCQEIMMIQWHYVLLPLIICKSSEKVVSSGP